MQNHILPSLAEWRLVLFQARRGPGEGRGAGFQAFLLALWGAAEAVAAVTSVQRELADAASSPGAVEEVAAERGGRGAAL